MLPCIVSSLAAGCSSDMECPLNEACYNRECQDPCIYLNCGTNAVCSVNSHLGICTCLEGHKGNPYHSCRRYECLTDSECPQTLRCDDEKCIDPCTECARNADCTAKKHRGICNCVPDFTGDPYGEECTPSKS
jgi:hypothetical protein